MTYVPEPKVKILKSSTTPAETKYGPFEYDYDNGETPSLGHVCMFSRSGYDVRVALVLYINKTGKLCVAARHTISFSSSAHLTAEPTFACSHQDLLSLVPGKLTAKDPHTYHMLATSRPHQYLMSLVPGELVPKVCPICQTLITKYDLPEDMMNQAVFWVVRDLGSCEWPADRPWFDQCRLAGARFSLNEIYW